MSDPIFRPYPRYRDWELIVIKVNLLEGVVKYGHFINGKYMYELYYSVNMMTEEEFKITIDWIEII